MTYPARKLTAANEVTPKHALDQFINEQNNKNLLRFITCGSVDDGKSTLIGRLLYDSKLIFEDQLSALKNESRKSGTQNGEIDYSYLVDGLAAEREQGITIDVAYRYFATDKRKFIVADTPGHEEYTRNMATGASTADLAIILIDARKGVLTQTKRHSYITNLMGIKNIVVAINKMDLVHYDEEVFYQIKQDFKLFTQKLGFENITFIPISALKGDNVIKNTRSINWYAGSGILEHLENIEVLKTENQQPFRLPVQWVNRPNLNFRGFSGNIASGEIEVGDEIVTLPSGRRSKVARILNTDREQNSAHSGQAVTLTLSDEIDVSRGDVIAKFSDKPDVTDQIQASIIWMNEQKLECGRNYYIKTCNKTVTGKVTEILYKTDIHQFNEQSAKTLSLNEVGVVSVSLNELIAFDRYNANQSTGSFIIIDRLTNETMGCGMIVFGLRKAKNIHWQDVAIGKESHARQKDQNSAVLWFTGLSGSGKSTIANLVEKRIYALGKHSYLLDGDNVRHGLNNDLGFSDQDRVENIRRISEVANLMSDAGLIVLTSFISPFENDRQTAREKIGNDYIEIFIDTPIEICEDRDPKGLYKKVRSGKLINFTGIDSPYEKPMSPDIHIMTDKISPEDAADKIINYLRKNDFI